MTQPAVLMWSGGKDSAMALYELRKRGEYDIVSLLTTVTREYDRISVHGVRRELLEQQARSLGLPVHFATIPSTCDNATYEAAMIEALRAEAAAGVTVVAAGDIFLADVRGYRERLVESAGLESVFPIWGRRSGALAHEVISLGFRAVLTCVDTNVLDRSYSGREFDPDLLADLPSDVDLCGENGEFHTFVYDGPGLTEPVQFDRGDVVVRDERFCFCDLINRRQETPSSTGTGDL